MKRLISFLVAAITIMSFSSCAQEEPAIPTPKLSFSDKVEADFESVTLSCSVSGNVTANKLTIEYSKNQDISEAQVKSFEKQGEIFCVTISGLEIQTTYYYRYTVENEASSYTDETIRLFKTLDYVAPIVTTGEAKNVSGTKATLEGSIDFTCGEKMQEKGFFFGKNDKNLEAIPTSESTLTLLVEGLDYGTTYYYQAYAKSEIGTGYGEIKEFKTCNAVTFNPFTVKEITAESAWIYGGWVADNGGVEVSVQMLCYCEKNSSEVIYLERFYSPTEKTMLQNLKAATTYCAWFYAKTFEGEFVGEITEFSTSDGSIIFGETTSSSITASTVSISSSVIADGGSTITKRGFAYGTTTLPKAEESIITITGTIGQLSGSIINLKNNTTYYVRPFAINNVGVSYGSQITITTSSGLAELGLTTISEIRAESVTFASNVVSSNGAAITNQGFCYGLAKNPTVDDNVLTVNSSGPFIITASSLTASTKYYVRPFATTAYGVTYGPENTFTTQSGMATLGTLTPFNVETKTASFSCEVSSDGGSAITERGFCYSTSPSPIITTSKIIVGGTVGLMHGTIDGLEPGTTYYVRAYANTKYNTSYSNEVQITTMLGLPILSDVTVSNIQQESVSLSSGISSPGDGYILEKGYCYSTSPSPDKNDNLVYVNSNNWDVLINGLQQYTKYYVRSFATTQYGTAYSEEILFTTSYYPIVFSDIALVRRSFTHVDLNCVVNDYGGNSIIEEGFCYSTSPKPTTNDSVVHCDGSTALFSIVSLSQGTKYYFRRFVRNRCGTFYSGECWCTTYSAPEESILGIFSVSDTKKVVFSRGNLRRTNNQQLSFAPNQYDYTQYESQTTTDPIDMFSTWEVKNGVIPLDATWSLLTSSEWKYLLEERQNAEALIEYNVRLDNYMGVLLFPDDWDIDGRPSLDYKALSLDEFIMLNNSGVVFIGYTGHLQAVCVNYSHKMAGIIDYFRRENEYGQYAFLITQPTGSATLSYTLIDHNGPTYDNHDIDGYNNRAEHPYGVIRLISVIEE